MHQWDTWSHMFNSRFLYSITEAVKKLSWISGLLPVSRYIQVKLISRKRRIRAVLINFNSNVFTVWPTASDHLVRECTLLGDECKWIVSIANIHFEGIIIDRRVASSLKYCYIVWMLPAREIMQMLELVEGYTATWVVSTLDMTLSQIHVPLDAITIHHLRRPTL